MYTVGDYNNEEIVSQMVHLLKEYEEIFPIYLLEMKGIARDIKEMKIQFIPDVKLMNKRPYRLNPKYKGKVQQELDKMLAFSIIVPIEEFERTNPMVVQNKSEGIHICVDL